MKGDPHIKSCESQIFKSRSRSTMKRFWNETWRLQKTIRRLYFQNFKKKRFVL